jgi:chromosome segregation protein
MFIKELEINGFKSFGEKTKISLNSNLTAIVGPNGCGKSNILDALKWVLGEKSVKSMRGDKMEDVIFSGTETKKASGFAQVDLIIDNKEKTLEIDSEEVKLTRKLFRDGQSHFYINENRITRKEVENILMDTGLGKASYSFMQQGQMDMILSSKPEDRRYIFEEAAGISRFKSQQEESEKKLEQTNFNLTRLKDIITELERELNLKKSQSEKTKVFQKYEEERVFHDQKIMFLTIQEMEENFAKLTEKLEKKQHEREKSRQKIFQIEEQIIQLDNQKQQLIDEMHQKDILHQLNNEKIFQLEKTNEVNNQRRKQVSEELNTISTHLENVQTRIKELKNQLNNQKQLFLQLNHQLGDTEKTILNINKNIDQHKKDIEIIIGKQNTTYREIENRREDLKNLRQEREIIIKDLLEFLKSEKVSYQKTLNQIEDYKNKFKLEVNEFAACLNEVITSFEGNHEKSIKDIKNLEKKLKTSEWISQIEILSNLEKEFWNTLFEKGGIHSKKEDFDEKIAESEKIIIEKENLLKTLETELNLKKENIIKLGSDREIMLGDIRTFELQKSNVNEKEKTISQQIENEEKNLVYFKERYSLIESELLQLNTKEKNINKEILALRNSLQNEINKIENFKNNIKKMDEKRDKLHEQMKKENSLSLEQFEGTNELEVKIGTILGAKEAMQQDIYNNFNLTIQELSERFKNKKIDLKTEKDKLNEIIRRIRELGVINPLAIEELNTVQSLYDHNVDQLNDILNAKKDIMLVIEEIREKSESIFLESFKQIADNFQTIFQKLFKGGDVLLKLTEESKPLESGIEINVQPPGKRARSLRLLSGGEKALTAIALMFGVYLVKSSPFCVLDEIDAPLDDQNVSRFLALLDDFKEKTQFILITHNKKTMGKAESLFGVTMDEPGISRLLSVEIKSA